MMHNISYYKNYLENFKNVNILVIGDIMLDRFIWGNVERISPEAPVPVVKVTRESYMAGGAANVAANIASLGGRSTIIGVTGQDQTGDTLLDILKEKNINTDQIIRDDKNKEGKPRNTIVKTRVIAHSQQVVRVDREDQFELSNKSNEKIINFVKKNIDKFDVVVIEDYGKGVINKNILEAIIPFIKKHNKFIIVDPKEEHFSLYKGVSAITPNHHEAGRAVGKKITDFETLLYAGNKLLEMLECDGVLITRGEKGMSIFEKGREPHHIPTIAQEIFDVSGAGDTVAATFSLALGAGLNMKQSTFLSNIAGGVVVGKIGVATINTRELENAIKQIMANS